MRYDEMLAEARQLLRESFRFFVHPGGGGDTRLHSRFLSVFFCSFVPFMAIFV
jgi:hypothetical protein